MTKAWRGWISPEGEFHPLGTARTQADAFKEKTQHGHWVDQHYPGETIHTLIKKGWIRQAAPDAYDGEGLHFGSEKRRALIAGIRKRYPRVGTVYIDHPKGSEEVKLRGPYALESAMPIADYLIEAVLAGIAGIHAGSPAMQAKFAKKLPKKPTPSERFASEIQRRILAKSKHKDNPWT